MLTVMPIKSIAYHDAQANETERHAAHFYGDEASRNLVSTYYDRDISGARGRWLLLGSTAGSAPSVFDEIDAGAPVLARHLHALAAGAAITQERSVREKSGDRRAGYDCVFAVPKSVSILIALGDHALTRAVVEAHENAVVQAMKYAFAAGCIEIRTGAAGRYRQAAKACAAPMYTHFLSSENDVQLHTHVVILNAGLRADGTVSAIDNLKFMQMRAIIAARYRAALADNLYSKLGLESENVERNFELVDCDSSLRDVFSKRKQQIDSYVAATDTTTARSRTIAQKAAYETRRKKQLGLVLPLLQKDWQRQIDEAGFSPDRMLQLIRSRAASRTLSISDRDQLLRRRTLEAIDGATALNCVIPARVFEQKIFEAGQSFGSVAAIETVVIDLSEKFIVGVRDGTGDQYHIAKESVHLEHALLNTARQGRQKWLQPASLTDAVKRRADLSDEQLAAALHALNSDLLAVVEGSPGSGKSHLLGAVTQALRDAGFKVLVTAPSHKAKAVIRDETKTEDVRALPIQTMARMLRAGSLAFDKKNVIIIDEGGMTALDDVNEVVQAAAKAGAKIIMSGDTKQLQPVGAGAPMLSLAKLLGSARVGEIRRQKVSWMRAASQDLVTDNVGLAIHEYRDHGAIQLRPSAQETLFSAADRAMHLALRQSELPAAEAMPLVMTHRRKDVLR